MCPELIASAEKEWTIISAREIHSSHLLLFFITSPFTLSSFLSLVHTHLHALITMLRLARPQGRIVNYSNTLRPNLQRSNLTARGYSTKSELPPPPPSSPPRSRLYRAGKTFLLIFAGLPVAGGLAWYTYDSFFEEKGDILHQKRPRRVIGGPKNLVMTHGCSGSILKAEEIHQNDPRQRLVILGSGWGVSLLFLHVLRGDSLLRCFC